MLSTVLSSTVLETTSFPEAAVKGAIYRRQCSPGNRHPEPNPRQEIQLAGLRDSGRRYWPAAVYCRQPASSGNFILD